VWRSPLSWLVYYGHKYALTVRFLQDQYVPQHPFLGDVGNLPPFFMFLSHHIAKGLPFLSQGQGAALYSENERGIQYTLRDGGVSGFVFA
jgi:hypothetical protein